jgi:hypothetical protein
MKLFTAWAMLVSMFYMGCVAAVMYVAWHFVAKVW